MAKEELRGNGTERRGGSKQQLKGASSEWLVADYASISHSYSALYELGLDSASEGCDGERRVPPVSTSPLPLGAETELVGRADSDLVRLVKLIRSP